MSYRIVMAGALLLASGGVLLADDPFAASTAAVKYPERAETPPACIWVDSDPEGTKAVVAKLRTERVSEEVVFDEVSLEEVIEQFEAHHGIAVVVDESALDDLGFSLDEPITCRVPAGLKLGDAMRLVLGPIECVCIVRGGFLTVTTHEAAASPEGLLVAVYPVQDLLLDGSYDALITTITSVVAVDTWAMNGGGEGVELVPVPQRGALVVSSTFSMHEEVAALLAGLRRLENDPHAKPYDTPTHHGFPQRVGGGGFGGGMGGGGGAFRVPAAEAAKPPSSD